MQWILSWHYLQPIVFSPFQLFAIALVLDKPVLASQLRKLIFFAFIILSTGYSTGLPSTAHPAWKYGWGLLNTWAGIVWTPLWLWCVDSRSSRCIRYKPCGGTTGDWVIQECPTSASIERVGWTLDLLSDFRAISWSHGHRKDSPWLNLQNPCSKDGIDERMKDRAELSDLSKDSKSFARDLFFHMLSLCTAVMLLKFCSFQYQQHLRLVSAHNTLVWTDGTLSYQTILATTRAVVAATCTYCLLVSIHNTITIAQKGWFWVRTWSVPPVWMFPPIFGHKLTADITVFWSKTWQDTFHFSLNTLSRRVKLGGAPKIANSLLQALFAFTLSGIFHAAASYAVNKDVESAFATLIIFIMQPVAAILQMLMFSAMKAARCPKYLAKAVTATFGFVWLVATVNMVAATPAFDSVLCSFA